MKTTDRSPRRSGKASGVSLGAIIGLIALLFFPTLAAHHFAQLTSPRLILGYFVILWLTTFLLYRHDKKRAGAGGWRTPENTLHLCELLGGWPAAFLAQRYFRHKNAKTRYQVLFWLIVLAHELISFDYISGWYFSRKLLRALHVIA